VKMIRVEGFPLSLRSPPFNLVRATTSPCVTSLGARYGSFFDRSGACLGDTNRLSPATERTLQPA
jgi:hypothetical protein